MLLSSFTHLPHANIGPSVICYMLILKILLIKFGIILKKTFIEILSPCTPKNLLLGFIDSTSVCWAVKLNFGLWPSCLSLRFIHSGAQYTVVCQITINRKYVFFKTGFLGMKVLTEWQHELIGNSKVLQSFCCLLEVCDSVQAWIQTILKIKAGKDAAAFCLGEI